MTTHDDFDRRLTAWLEATAPAREPESLAERVLARTAATRRRPAWAIPERWTPVTSMTSQTARLGRAQRAGAARRAAGMTRYQKFTRGQTATTSSDAPSTTW